MFNRRFLIVAAATVLASAAQADTIFVDDDAPFGGDGSSWTMAYKFLQDALADAAASGGAVTEIRVGQGTYKPDQDEAGNVTPGDREATFLLINDVTLVGGFAGIGAPNPDERDIGLFETILSGDLAGNDGANFANNGENSYHVTTGTGTDQTAILDGFTITSGNANGPFPLNVGGGMFNCGPTDGIPACGTDASPTVANCTFTGNSGGGMWNEDGASPMVSNCVFVQNDGDGIHTLDQCSLTVIDSVFAENTGSGMVDFAFGSSVVINCEFNDNLGRGMTIDIASTTLVVDCTFASNAGGSEIGDDCVPMFVGCTFTGNDATNGGAVRGKLGSAPTFIACIFDQNCATGDGGAIHSRRPEGMVPLFVNCLFNDNTAANQGGAIYNDGTSPTIINCTFQGNQATAGGGIYNTFCPFFSVPSEPTITNCILWNNTPDQIFDDVVNIPPADTTVHYSDVQGGWSGTGSNNIDADPLFVDAINGDLRLQAGSPCIDAGDNTAVPDGIDTDLDDNPRFVDDPDTADSGNGDPPVVDMGAYEFRVPCPWDLDGDGNVFVTDLLLLLMDFGSCEGSPSDFDGDGCVTVMDLLTLLGNWGPCPGSPCVWDVNGDGTVDQSDLQQVLDNFGPCDGCPEDINGDGVVNGQDAAAVATHFGPCP